MVDHRVAVTYRISKPELICKFFSSPGGTSERIFLYFSEVSEVDRVGEGGGVQGEDVRVVTASSAVSPGSIIPATASVIQPSVAAERAGLVRATGKAPDRGSEAGHRGLLAARSYQPHEAAWEIRTDRSIEAAVSKDAVETAQRARWHTRMQLHSRWRWP
jgi:hypothetical protein